MSTQVFEGVKVLDFTWAGAGPMAVRYLADHGAEVIHVESATTPEILRTTPPFRDGIVGMNRSAYFPNFNCNKYGISLNLNHPRASEVTERLVAWSDIVAENFRPGVMKRWRLAYEDLIKIKPDLIMLSSSQQGQTGPRSTQPGLGAQLVSLAGFTQIGGWPDRGPTGPYGPYTDTIAPLFSAAALIAALDYRRRTGKGQHLDISQYEAAAQFLAPLFLDYEVNGRVAGRNGNRSDYAAPHGAYACRGDDRWCVIAVFNDDEWRRLCAAMGAPELVDDPRFADLESRKRHEDDLDRLVSDWTQRHTAEEVMGMLQAQGVDAGVVQTAEDLHSDPQLAYRHFFRELEHSEIGPHFYDGSPFILSDTPADLHRAGPCMGEHNEPVVTGILGFSDAEFLSLLEAGVFE
ncbi:MAG: CoA transferase [Chloroflexi bacterium]|nr:CoA transferase [Chloroflexota bacterium]